MTDAEKELQREIIELRELAKCLVHVLAGRPEFRHMRDAAAQCVRAFDRAKQRVERENLSRKGS